MDTLPIVVEAFDTAASDVLTLALAYAGAAGFLIATGACALALALRRR